MSPPDTRNFASDIAKASRRWSDYFLRHPAGAPDRLNRAEWLGHPSVQARRALRRRGRGIETWFIDECLHGRIVGHGLGIGAGGSSFELNLVRSGHVKGFDLFDLSQHSLDAAKHMATSLGLATTVSFNQCDINSADLATSSYDVVTCISSLHHIEQLDLVIGRCRRALRPGGVLFASEYVGPNRFDFPVSDRIHAERLFNVLASQFRGPGHALMRPTPEEVVRVDPTEAIHSAEILDCLRQAFRSVTVFPQYGCLPFILWWGLNHDALFEEAAGHDLVELICDLDEALTDGGRTPHYFVDILATDSP